jgi:hypothetical protein
MKKCDEYRFYAHEAHEEADRAKSENDKSGWLRIAHSWLALAAQRQRNLEKIEQDEVKVAQELFDAQAKVRGGGPDDPDVIH